MQNSRSPNNPNRDMRNRGRRSQRGQMSRKLGQGSAAIWLQTKQFTVFLPILEGFRASMAHNLASEPVHFCDDARTTIHHAESTPNVTLVVCRKASHAFMPHHEFIYGRDAKRFAADRAWLRGGYARFGSE